MQKFKQAYEESEGQKLSIPVLVGVLPLASLRHANFLQAEVPGIDIPREAFHQMEQAGENGAAAGIKLAVDLAQQVREQAQGVYIMPAFGRYDRAAEIIESVAKLQ